MFYPLIVVKIELGLYIERNIEWYHALFSIMKSKSSQRVNPRTAC